VSSLPPLPDPATDALARGEPAVVVAQRVEARGRILSALIYSVAILLSVVLAGYAYLRRHRMAGPVFPDPRSKG
jgi:hypothetical protein